MRAGEPSFNSVFEKAFYLSDEPMDTLQKELPDKDFQTVHEVFEKFHDYFELIYEKERPKLNAWEKKLKNDSLLPINDQIQHKLEIFYNEKIKEPKTLTCYLLLAPEGHSGSYISDQFITQALSSFDLKRHNEIIGTIWHETIHAYFDKHYFREIVKEITTDDKETVALKEITASSILPLGYLGEYYFNIPPTKKIYPNYEIGETETKKIVSLAKEYIDGGLILDKNFITTLRQFLKS